MNNLKPKQISNLQNMFTYNRLHRLSVIILIRKKYKKNANSKINV